jgi:transposase InsO family protein
MSIPVNRRWAEFRHGIIGNLLASPPQRGDLSKELEALSRKIWIHPTTQEGVTFTVPTIERWYYKAKKAQKGTFGSLGRKRRKDADQSMVSGIIEQLLLGLYSVHKGWSIKLLADNLAVLCIQKNQKVPAYQTVRRYYRSKGLAKVRRKRKMRPGELEAEKNRLTWEVRSYEATHVGGLAHLDFHHCSRQIVTADGLWLTPSVLAIIDDFSRLILHIQWYLTETTEDLVHGFSQALMRRGLIMKLMTDNGAAMKSAEFTEGLARLDVIHDPTQTYSPHQNGKIESFWNSLEGRLMAMLEGVEILDLEYLNRATLSWVELEYNHAIHSETKQTPVERFSKSPSVMRPKPSPEVLRQAFRMEEKRIQRRSDGTLTISGVRFEIPDRYRHFRQVTVRYARWDLNRVDLICPKTDIILTSLIPIDKAKNADGRRRVRSPQHSTPSTPPSNNGPAPLLAKLMEDYANTGLPPAYLPQH